MPRLFPRIWLGLIVLWLVWVALVVLLALVSPAMLHLLTAAALIGHLWSSLPGRWPPGNLSWTDSLQAICDADFYQRQSQQLGPVFKMLQFHRRVICVVGIERARALLSRHKDALSPCPLPFHHCLTGGFLRYMEPEVYARYGPAFRRAMSKQIIGEADAALRTWTRAYLGKVFREGLSLPSALHLISQEVFFQKLLGLSADNPLSEDFREEYDRFCRQSYSTRPSRSTLASLDRLCGLMTQMSQRGCGGGVLAELGRHDSGLPDRICQENLAYILRISTSNASDFLHWLLVELALHPSWWKRLRSEGGQVLDRLMQETLRLHQSEYLYRRVAAPFEFEGWHFPKGWLVRICVRESHLDPKVFDEPWRFDPDRFLQSPDRERYSPFGMFEHACNGVPLNQLIARLVVEELMQLGDLVIEAKAMPVRDFRHWSHWRPGCRLRFRPASWRDRGPDDPVAVTGPGGSS